jgi:hypothetical protein
MALPKYSIERCRTVNNHCTTGCIDRLTKDILPAYLEQISEQSLEYMKFSEYMQLLENLCNCTIEIHVQKNAVDFDPESVMVTTIVK